MPPKFSIFIAHILGSYDELCSRDLSFFDMKMKVRATVFLYILSRNDNHKYVNRLGNRNESRNTKTAINI